MRYLQQKTLQQAASLILLPAIQAIYVAFIQGEVFTTLSGNYTNATLLGPLLGAYVVMMILGVMVIAKRDCRICKYERTQPGCAACLKKQILNNTILQGAALLLQVGAIVWVIVRKDNLAITNWKIWIGMGITLLAVSSNAYLLVSNVLKMGKPFNFQNKKKPMAKA